MRALYVGILTNGTTSRMRADTLRTLLPGVQWDFIDTDEGFQPAGRLSKSFSFRMKSGHLVNDINRKIADQIREKRYKLVWVDKGVYIWPRTTRILRKSAENMVHFTPDTAFHANRSRHFYKSALEYDLLVTTKSFELDRYGEIADSNQVMLTTQAYDPNLHQLKTQAEPNRPVAVFIGLCESDRQSCVAALLKAGVPVRVGGEGWESFAGHHASDPKFHFLGQKVFGAQYAEEYRRASVGLGLLTKRFPELHTTRTFEIPACGTMLATEHTEDTARFFGDDEVLFFEDYQGLAQSLKDLLKRPQEIEAIATKGHQRVIAEGRDYSSVLSGILQRLSISG